MRARQGGGGRRGGAQNEENWCGTTLAWGSPLKRIRRQDGLVCKVHLEQ